MNEEIPGIALTDAPSTRQRLYIRYLLATLIDLTVLNLFAEHWAHVTVSSFTVSIFAALLLQLLLRATLALEHRVAEYFNAKSGAGAKFMRYLTAWLILFGSKFVMLGAIDLAFGEEIGFSGPVHGVVAFIVVVVVMLLSEEIASRTFHRLADRRHDST
jgi:hypothetical protein